MAIFNFTESIYKKKPISVYGNGKLERDFTYVEDITSYINKLLNKKFFNHQIINIGNTKPVKVIKLISYLEEALNMKAKINFLKTPKTEVYKTCANISKLKKLCSLKKTTSLKTGINNFVKWYKQYKIK